VPALLAPFVGFSLGALLAWIRGADESDDDAPFWHRTSGSVLLFAIFVFAPVAGYFLIFAGDWAWAYLVDARRIPSALEVLVVAVDAACVPLGFEVARRQLRSRRAFGALATAAVPAGIALLSVMALFSRLRVDATFRQFRGEFGAEPLAGGPLGYAVLWMNLMLAAGMIVASQRRPRNAPPEPPTPLAGDPPRERRRLLGTGARPRNID
jgi:hypothetical protein